MVALARVRKPVASSASISPIGVRLIGVNWLAGTAGIAPCHMYVCHQE